MRHTLLFVSSVALAAVLTTAHAENTPKPDQASETTTENTEAPPADAAKAAAEAGDATESAEATESSGEAPTGDATEAAAEDATPPESAESEAAESESPSASSEESTDSAEEAPKDGETAADTTADTTADATVPPTEGAAVYIIYPSDGSELTSPVKVVFGLDGMGVAPAGVDVENTGHHHLIVDGGDELPAAGEVMGDNVLHFGGGQTETDLELEPGEHTLQLILGDKEHKPFDPTLVSEKIKITVIK